MVGAYPKTTKEKVEITKVGAKKTLGIILLVVGIVILVLSLTADLIGIGRTPGFRHQQITGTVIGAIVMVVGLILTLRKPKQPDESVESTP